MEARLQELLDKQYLTKEEIEELEEREEVASCEWLGVPRAESEYVWLDVTTTDNEHYDIYCNKHAWDA